MSVVTRPVDMSMEHQDDQSPTTSGSGAVLIIPDVPLGLDFGINCMSFETGPKFRGMSMIPQGLHFIYHSTGMAARQGFFLRSDVTDVIVRQWDSFEEHISAKDNLSTDSMSALCQQLNRGDLNANLGPYPVAEHHIWQNLSCYIYENVLNKAGCPMGEIIYSSEAQDLAAISIPNSSGANQRVNKFEKKESTGKEKSPLLGNVAQFVDIIAAENRLREVINSSEYDHQDIRATMLTSLYIDKSTVLENLVETEYGGSWENILGEMQLSFILFLLIFCYDALEHWKKLVDTICRSERILISKPDLATAFMRILYAQLNFSPADFFANELSKDNFLRPAVSSLFENMKQPKGVLSQSVLEHKKRLLNFFQKKFNLFLDSEDVVSINSKKNKFNDDDYNLVDEDKPAIISIEEMEASDSRMLRNNGDNNSNPDNNAMEIGDNNESSNISDTAHDSKPLEIIGTMSVSQIEIGMFSWRYPNLYDSMCADLNEDMEMTALRILSESESEGYLPPNIDTKQGKGIRQPDTKRLAALEAKMFLEDEVSKRTLAS